MDKKDKPQITLFMAISLNGIIATENGDENFLSDENWNMFCKLVKEYGNFIYGRKTYEAVQKWGNIDSFTEVQKVIISKKIIKLDKSYILADSPEDAVSKLSEKGFKKILVAGGANINSAFAKLNLFDEIILNIEPIIIGKGISLFALEDFELKIKLISKKISSSGILTLKYKVLK